MNTPKLSLPILQPAQAQKHIIVNEALERMDAAVQLSIIGEVSAPDAESTEGQSYRVGASPVGVFTGHEGDIATLGAGGWNFLTPQPGWVCWDMSAGQLHLFDLGVWRPLIDGSGPLDRLGINTVSDLNNRLSVKADSTLLDAEGGSHQLVMNRATIQDTVSLVMQTAYAGQAELGLTGATGLALRVSADGTSWSDVMAVDSATGDVTFPSSQFGEVRRIVITSGSGTYTVPDKVRALQVLAQGGGGGGAGAETPTVDVLAGAGGGGGGASVDRLIEASELVATYSYAVGAAGAGGAATVGDPTGARDGESGGDTSFTGGAVSVLAGGGFGAPEKDARAGHSEYAGGAGGLASGGDLNLPGGAGGGGLTAMVDYFMLGTGFGGSSQLGNGGVFNNGNGRAGSGYGSGGAGAGMIPRFVLNRSGGAGAAGCLMITEYY